MHYTAEWSNVEMLTELIHTVVWSARVLAILHWCAKTKFQGVSSPNPLHSSVASSSGQQNQPERTTMLAPKMNPDRPYIESMEIATRVNWNWHDEYQRRVTDSNCKIEDLSNIARFYSVVAKGQYFKAFGEPSLSGKVKPVCKECTCPPGAVGSKYIATLPK